MTERPRPSAIVGDRLILNRDGAAIVLAGREHNIVVLTTEVSGLYRSVDEGRELIRQGARMNKLTRPARLVVMEVSGTTYDLSTDRGRNDLTAKILAAQTEATTIRDRRLRKERIRARDGLYFGRRPFGYTQDTDPGTETLNGHLSICDGTDPAGPRYRGDPAAPLVDEAALIRAAAARIIREDAARPDESPSCGAIAAEWNAAGVLTSWGNEWTGGTVALLLQRELLTSWPGDATRPADPARAVREHRPGTADGRPPAGRPPKRSPAVWPPILDRATFDAVGVILTDPRRRLNLGDNRLATPLSGLAYCGACGARLLGAPMRPGRHDRRLKCAVTGCGKVARAMTPVEVYVRKLVLAWLAPGGPYAQHRAALAASGAAERANARIAELDAQIAAGRARIGEAEAAAADAGDITLAVGIIGRIRADLATLAAERTAARREAAAAAPDDDRDGDGFDWAAATAAERRDWLRQYVDRVTIYPNRPGTPRHWFDPAIVEVHPGPWAAGIAPAALAPAAGLAAVARPPKAPPKPCDLAPLGCDRPHEGHGLCRLHNRRRWEAERAGHPGEWDRSPLPHRGKPAPGTPPRLCDLPDCGRDHEAHGLCYMHLMRKRTAERAGHPDEWDRSPAPHRGRRVA